VNIRGARIDTIAALVVVGLAVGAGSTLVPPTPATFVAVLAAPFLVLLLRRSPELALTLFLFAGSFKSVLPLPVDVTLLLAVALLVLTIMSVGREGVRPTPVVVWLFVALAAILIAGIPYSANPAYGISKTMRFATLGLITPIVTLQLIRTPESVKRFVYSTIGLGLVMSVVAILGGGDPEFAGKYTAFGSDTIALGRAAGYSFGLTVLLVLWDHRRLIWAAPVAAICLVALVGSGSRGPLVGLGIGLVVLFAARLFTRGAMRLGIAIVVAILCIAVLASTPLLPEASLGKLTRITSEASSADPTRVMLADQAARMVFQRPLTGHGTGSFAAEDTGFEYPHNMVLEAGSENGVVAAIIVIAILGIAAMRATEDILTSQGPWTEMVMLLFVIATTNAMVTGDLNSNRLLFAAVTIAAAHAAREGDPA
jgi:O-antigen ligase